jgi:hypothetical protein
MARKFLLTASAAGLWALSGAALASGDSSCYSSWKLSYPTRDCASRAIISPSNDTRVNMLFLMRDFAGTGAGTADLAYPKYSWTASDYGHTFFDWSMLKEGFFPSKANSDETDSGSYAGSRCNSLNAGTTAFAAAMAANAGLPGAERDKLTTARTRLVRICEIGAEALAEAQRYHKPGEAAPDAPPPLPEWPAGITSARGKAFLAYLQASGAFYGEQWDMARSGFASLTRAGDPWVAETAAYMQARVELNAAMAKSIDEYGSFQGAKSVDQTAVTRAQASLAAYLKAWPQGRYAASAQGLRRRALWLAGDWAALSLEYERLMRDLGGKDARSAALIEEIDNKLLYPNGEKGDGTAAGALLLATQDLAAMRYGYSDDSQDDSKSTPPSFALASLNEQQATFAGQPTLWAFLQANHAFYIARDYKRVLSLIPDAARQDYFTPLAFSSQMLRGQALAMLGDRNEAGFWLELLGGAKGLWQRPTVELALAMNFERHGKLADLFAKGSPITDSQIRIILLSNSAGPDILRAQALDTTRPAAERNVALYTLLTKQLSTGDFAGFVTDSRLTVPKVEDDAAGQASNAGQSLPNFTKGKWSDGYACPALVETARKLARNRMDLVAQLCLGDFWRLNGFDPYSFDGSTPKPDELGGAAHLFPGELTMRGPIYAAIIANPQAPAADKAYALYRAVNCYGPAGSNACGGADVAKSVRRGWFTQLKRDYPASEWAKKLRYFW